MDVDSPLKRCSSAPIISNANATKNGSTTSSTSNNIINTETGNSVPGVEPSNPTMASTTSTQMSSGSLNCETPPAPNIFSRTRRYSASSFSPLGSPAATGPRLTPRVSQLRQEECADISNSREVNHERDLHSAIQISQSWEDLTIVTENWSCRDDLTMNPLLNLNCSSPSPTSRHHQQQQQSATATTSSAGGLCGGSYASGIRYPFGMSPSPTRKTFATRRSMSPNHVRPSQLCPVKRKFDMDDSSSGNGSASSPPPHKKMFLDIGGCRGSSSPSHHPLQMVPICPSPDSGTYEGRTTPRSFISKLCSSNSLSSFSSASASPTSQLEMNAMADPASQFAAAMASSAEKGNLSGNSNSNSSSNNNNINNPEAKEDAESNGKSVEGEEEEARKVAAMEVEGSDCDHCDKGEEANGNIGIVDSPMTTMMMKKEQQKMKDDDIVDDGIGDEVVVGTGDKDEQVGENVESFAVGI